MTQQDHWAEDCLRYRGHVIKGPDAHWCHDWDGLPVTALTPEYGACTCDGKTLWGRIVHYFFMWWWCR